MIRDWLVSPSWRASCDDLATLLDAEGSPWGSRGRWTLTQGPEVAPLKGRLYDGRPLQLDQPLPDLSEGGPVSWLAPGGMRRDHGAWRRVRTGADGLVDWSDFCFQPEYRHAIAGTAVEVDQPEWRTIEIGCTGPVAIWLGGTLLASYRDVSYMEPVTHTARVRLGSGVTTVHAATWQVGFREVRHVCRVAIRGLPVRVVIPSPAADEAASSIAESVLDSLALDSWALPSATAGVSGPPGAALRVSRPGGPDQHCVLKSGRAEIPLPEAGPGAATLTFRIDDDRCPVIREMPVAVLPAKIREHPCGDDPAVWRREVLSHVASSPPSVARALAATPLPASGPSAAGGGGPLMAEDLEQALTMLTDRADCADFEAVGLMNLWHALPPGSWPGGTREQVRTALLGFKYWLDQPGLDAMCYFTENHQLVFHTAELLAGSAFAGETFTNTGWTGARHAAHGRDMAMRWIRARLSGGFSEFDSNAYLAIDSLALVSLAEHAPDEEVTAAAEALLDKLLFTLAANSWHGIHGSAHGRSHAQTLRSSRFEETGPIMWALWGTGALNHAVLPAACLALARRYRPPELLRAVARAGEPWWGRQVYRGQHQFERDLLSRAYGSDVRIWKTGQTLLSSVQDYRPGLPGLQEHVWGATLGPEVQVFATYPACDSDSESARPNAWAGQRVLPRARQDRDTVLVVYPCSVPPAAGLPTHLWFPAPFMDETTRHGPWLAGRVGSGYVAAACAGGLQPVRTGGTAGQEWRPAGDGRAFVATVGCAGQDGSFGEFVRALGEPGFPPGDGVEWTARDGRRLVLPAAGSFTVDGASPDIGPSGRPGTDIHLDNPACVTRFGDKLLTAEYGGHRMVLDIVRARRAYPRAP